MATNAAVRSSTNKLDFKTLLEAYAYISYLKSKKKSSKIKAFLLKGTSSEFEELVFDVNWDNARLYFEKYDDDGEPFLQEHTSKAQRPVIGTCQYEGSGVSDMEVTHQGHGKTTVNLSVKWNDGNTFGLGLSSPISLPFAAKELFGPSAAVDINRDSFEISRDQEWTFTVKVPVPRVSSVMVDTSVEEETYEGTIIYQPRLSGRVSVQMFKKKGHQSVVTITDSIINIWIKMKWELNKVKSDRSSKQLETSIANRLEASTNLPEQSGSELKWRVSGDCCFTKGIRCTIKVTDTTKSLTLLESIGHQR